MSTMPCAPAPPRRLPAAMSGPTGLPHLAARCRAVMPDSSATSTGTPAARTGASAAGDTAAAARKSSAAAAGASTTPAGAGRTGEGGATFGGPILQHEREVNIIMGCKQQEAAWPGWLGRESAESAPAAGGRKRRRRPLLLHPGRRRSLAPQPQCGYRHPRQPAGRGGAARA